jgi:hypothetical protein
LLCLAYQNKVCCWKKLNLVGNKKYSLVFKNPHQAFLQKVNETINKCPSLLAHKKEEEVNFYWNVASD